MSTLQTLDRGLVALRFVADHPEGVVVREVAEHLEVHRSIAHRIVATLAAHGLVTQGPGGRYLLGPSVPVLGSRYAPHVLTAARPALASLAQQTRATAFLCVADGPECAAVLVEEPRGQLFRVAYRVGSRHPLDQGAPGLALLAGRAPVEGEPAEATRGRERGWVASRGALQEGAAGVAAPVGAVPALGLEASLGVVDLGPLDLEATGPLVVAAVSRLREALGVPAGS